MVSALPQSPPSPSKPTQFQWYYGLLIFAVIGVVVANIIRILTPPPIAVPETPLLTQQLDGVTPIFSNLQFTGTAPEFPDQLPVAQHTPSSNAASDLLATIINKYNLTPHPVLENLWSSDTVSLYWRPETSGAELAFITPLPPSETGPFPTATSLQVAQQFVAESLPFLTGVEPLTNQLAYFGGTTELVPVADSSEATQVDIPFAQQIKGFPIMVGTSIIFPVEIFVDRSGTILKVLFSPTPLSFTLTAEQALLSLDEAVANINNQKGTIVGYSVETGTQLSLDTITSGELSTVVLEYRLDPTVNLLYPFYRFSGKVTTAEGTSIVEVMTPAIKTTPAQ